MDREIFQKLRDVERQHDVQIINARIRGSRMLGADHEDSDWDVMFLFCQEPHKYATMYGRIDSIDMPHLGENENIDLSGWNVDKFGELLADSNPNAIEYCRPDPKEYIRAPNSVSEEFNEMAENARRCFNHMSLYHHYISMAKSNWKKYIDSGKDCTKGRQFYVARSVGMAQGIRKGGEMPPLDARELADYEPLNSDLRRVIAKLTEAKRAGHGEDENTDIVGPLYSAESETEMEPTDERIAEPRPDLIDSFIRSAVEQ